MSRKRIVDWGEVQRAAALHAKTAEKAENHSKEGLINTTVCKSGVKMKIVVVL